VQLGAGFFNFFKMQLRVKRRNLTQLGVIARSKSFKKFKIFMRNWVYLRCKKVQVPDFYNGVNSCNCAQNHAIASKSVQINFF
jgi:hypothetical protein